jgi:2,4'-dihydroxyacetophenone dioxygenase
MTKPIRSPYVSAWSPHEMVEEAVAGDERLWMPTTPGVWVRPLIYDTAHGAWVNVMRTDTEGVISRHRHPAPVHGYVISGSWRYLEHDWVATAGMYVYEPPGEVHTLVVNSEPGLTLFWITGCMIHIDEDGQQTGYTDVFSRIAEAERHFESVGLGADYVKRFIR